MLQETIVQEKINSSPTKTTAEIRRRRRQKSFWRFAKRLMISDKNRSTAAAESASTAKISVQLEPDTDIAAFPASEAKFNYHQLNVPVLLSVFEYLPLLTRIRLRMACKLTNFIYGSIPIVLSPIKLQTTHNDELRLFTENPDFIINHLIPEALIDEVNYEDDYILIKKCQAQLLIQRIAQRIDIIEHLWLETTINDSLCSTLLNELESEYGRKFFRKRKLKLQKLTVIGNKMCSIAEISEFIQQFSPSLEHLRLRHMRMDSKELSEEFWSAVKKCNKLRQFQYETCRYDKYSHMFIANTLCNKNITTLEISGIYELTGNDLAQISRQRPMKHLSVLCPKINAASYLNSGIVESIEHVHTLLLQCDSTFMLDNMDERKTMEQILRRMKDSSHLEVLHDVSNRVAQAARTISYWLQLSKETNRTIILKLSDISQEKIDQAIGRIMRKCDSVFKASASCTALVLTRGIGRVHLLDNHTWFGEDDDES
uniref:F-box domain-containing protein n=1 Tax=Syphacia muris TaxID=451379 RepID=A0A0N5AKT9_9BILA